MEIYDIIKSFEAKNYNIEVNKKTMTLKTKDKIFKFDIKIKGQNMDFLSKDNNDLDSNILCNIIKKNNYNNINIIFDLLEFLDKVLINIHNFCGGCYQQLDFQSDEYISCGKVECDYKLEELLIGNPLTNKFKEDQDMFKFLIESAFDAIKCQRKYDIFEPFPKYFLKKGFDLKIDRGNLSKLTGDNFDDYKDFDRLDKTINSLNLKKFYEDLDILLDDNEILKNYGQDCYRLLRFIIMSNKIDFFHDTSLFEDFEINEKCKIYKIVHQVDKENEFEKIYERKTYLFHGSRWHNWYSIMRNGLKNCSRTKLMTAGAAYGNGIYLSDNFSLSSGYGSSGKKNVVGVLELRDDASKYKKGGNVFVVDNEKVLLLRYLLIIPSSLVVKVINLINNVFINDIYKKEAKVQTTVLGKGIKKLIREYKLITKQNPDDLGFTIKSDPKNAYLWYVNIHKYDESYEIGKDMEKLGIKEINLEIKFPPNYPFSPPFVRIISPRFKHLTGNITSNGAICMQVLTEKFWSPACSIESLIVSIKSQILEGEGRLDFSNQLPYSEKEARESFTRVARGHGWI